MVDYVETVKHDTSVKQINIIEAPTDYSAGEADFKALKVFSVFDVGRMEPTEPLDNSTITLMAGYNFELLREHGINSHYLGLVTEDGQLVDTKYCIKNGITPDKLRLQFVNRMKPVFIDGDWDYSMFKDPTVNNYVQPMEFIQRNSLPAASSLWGRIERGEVSLSDFGLPNLKPGDAVPEELIPLLDYSTKFEPEDRYVRASEAQRLLGVSDERFTQIKDTLRKTSIIMTDYAASRGFKREDGKFELIVVPTGDGIADILGDAVCTWHEDRLVTPQGLGISKQRIRDKIVELNPEWYQEVKAAKKQARIEGIEDFRTLLSSRTPPIMPSADFFKAVNTLFRAGTNQWIGSKVYQIYPEQNNTLEDDLEKAVEEFKKAA